MGIRQRMTHRAIVERDGGTTLDPYGAHIPSLNPTYGGEPIGLNWGVHPLNWGVHRLEWGSSLGSALPCYVQSQRERTVTAEGKIVAVTMLTIWAPMDADLRNEDIVIEVTNLQGNVLYEGKRRVTALIARETHLEGMLEYYG